MLIITAMVHTSNTKHFDLYQKKWVNITAKHADALACPEGNEEVIGSGIFRRIS